MRTRSVLSAVQVSGGIVDHAAPSPDGTAVAIALRGRGLWVYVGCSNDIFPRFYVLVPQSIASVSHTNRSYDMRYSTPVLVRCGSSNESIVKMEW
jgi:hypothetical protein